jgi:AcrR family transcriptional regulator
MVKRTTPMTRENRRKQLLKIARQLVAKEGMGALTMMALSDRAKVAKPVVYSHFPNREAVAIALLAEHFEASATYTREYLKGATTLEEYFSRLVDAAFNFEGASDTPVRKITNGFSAGDEVNEAFLRHEEAFRLHWELILQFLDVRKERIEVAAYALHGMMDNTVYTFAITPQAKVARSTLKTMLLETVAALAPDRKRKIQGASLAEVTDPKSYLKRKTAKVRGAPKTSARERKSKSEVGAALP